MKLNRIFPAIFLVALISGCTTGPKYTEIQSSISGIESGNGRIYFYRPAKLIGGGIRPAVKLNGEKIGKAKPGGFFFVDRSPGDYEVLLSTEVDKKLTFQLDKGQKKYVRMTVGMGAIVYRVYPELVDQAKALEEIKSLELSYIGSPMK